MQFSTKRFFILILFFATQLQANNNPAARQLTEQEIFAQKQQIIALTAQLQKSGRKNEKVLTDEDNQKRNQLTSSALLAMNQKELDLIIESSPIQVKKIIERCNFAQKLKESCVNEYDEFERQIILPHVLVLVGPPGTGKSDMALAISNKINRPSFLLEPTQMATKYKNSEAENLVNEIKNIKALDQECTIILEELPSLVNLNQHRVDMDPAAPLWREMDHDLKEGKKIFYIITANDISKLPLALRSRINASVIHVDLPDENARKNALDYRLKKYLSDKQIQNLTNMTEKFSFRAIKDLSEKIIIDIKLNDRQLTADEFEKFIEESKAIDDRSWSQIPWGEKNILQRAHHRVELGNDYMSNKTVLGCIVGAGYAVTGFTYDMYTNLDNESKDTVNMALTMTSANALPHVIAAGKFAYAASAAGLPAGKAVVAGIGYSIATCGIFPLIGIPVILAGAGGYVLYRNWPSNQKTKK